MNEINKLTGNALSGRVETLININDRTNLRQFITSVAPLSAGLHRTIVIGSSVEQGTAEALYSVAAMILPKKGRSRGCDLLTGPPLHRCYHRKHVCVKKWDYGRKVCKQDVRAPATARPGLRSRDGSDGMAREVFCSVHVPKSNYCIVGRYLLSDAAWRELYPLEQTRGNTFEELKKRLLSTNGHEESPLELIVRFHGLRQSGCNQSIKLYIQEVAEF
ncbi:hypothetical protein T07_2248 [Trichinella nelsoni]|uniref:Uncharacterized protein n=1 Tax=Trichinella nelsoni TaxID=6336 RepID=A0A0V0S9X3_9BILA|nr:hypothetical protein T07_2248 [Trichinella nelsoni]